MIKPEAPIDPLTHSPLPFVPDPNLPPVPTRIDEEYDRTITSFHHPVFKRRTVEGFGVGGKAARDSYLQWTWTWQHDLFHDTWGGLVQYLPNTSVRQYRITLFGLMRYVPRQAIDFSGSEPQVVDMAAGQQELLREQLIVGHDGARMRRFLFDHSLDSCGADDSQEGELLWLARQPKRGYKGLLTLADKLICQSIDPLVTPGLKQVYEYTRKHEMVRLGLPDSIGTLIRTEILKGFSPPEKLINALVSKIAVKQQIACAR